MATGELDYANMSSGRALMGRGCRAFCFNLTTLWYDRARQNVFIKSGVFDVQGGGGSLGCCTFTFAVSGGGQGWLVFAGPADGGNPVSGRDNHAMLLPVPTLICPNRPPNRSSRPGDEEEEVGRGMEEEEEVGHARLKSAL